MKKSIWFSIFGVMLVLAVSLGFDLKRAYAGGGSVPKPVQCATNNSPRLCYPESGDPKLMNSKYALVAVRPLLVSPDGKSRILNYKIENGEKVLNPICPEGGAKQGQPTCYDPTKVEYEPNAADACFANLKRMCEEGAIS